MNILKTRLYSQEINLEKLHEFSNTIFYRKQMKQDFMCDIFHTSSHSISVSFDRIILSFQIFVSPTYSVNQIKKHSKDLMSRPNLPMLKHFH